MTSSPPPVLCIIGRKNAGKTTLTVALAGELGRRGWKVMTVKRGHGFDLDQPGKDSWRHRHEGGAVRTVLVGPEGFAVVGQWPRQEMSLSEVSATFLTDADLILAEGFKRAPEPKIEVLGREGSGEPLLGALEEGSGPILAMVSEKSGREFPVPSFSVGNPDAGGILPPSPGLSRLADFIEATVLRSGKGR